MDGTAGRRRWHGEAAIACVLAGTGLRASLLALGLTFAGLAMHAVSGVELLARDPDSGFRIAPQVHVTAMCAGLIAYGLVAVRWLTSGRTTTPAGTTGSRLAGVLGIAVGMMLIAITNRQIAVQEPWRDLWSPGELYVDFLALLLLWGVARGIHFSTIGADRSGIADAAIDLWDTAPLQKLCSGGMRFALAWSLGISISVLGLFVDPNPTLQVDSIRILGPILAVSTLTAGLSLALPLGTIRIRIRDAKATTVAGIDLQLASLRRAETRGILAQAGREADLLARRSFVLGVSDWAMGGRALQVLVLYILIPAGSWLAGPVLRQLLSNVLIVRLAEDLMHWLTP